MPKLQYPRSDIQRLETLRRAKRRAEQVDASEMVLSATTQATLNSLCDKWEKEVRERDLAVGEQSQATQQLTAASETLRLYLSHFIQVFNMGVDRGAFNAAERAAYQMPTSQNTLPALSSEADLTTWAERLISGEAKRQADGLAPLTLPSIEEVQEKYSAFKEARLARDKAQDSSNKENADVHAMRNEVEDFVREDLWYEIIGAFRKEEPGTQRRKARQWGVRYRFQKGETPMAGETVDTDGVDVVSED